MNTDTPRTDEATLRAIDIEGGGEFQAVHIQVSKQLERELTTAREKLSEWSILNGWGGTPEIINDFIKGQQTRIHYAQNLDEELTAVTEQRDRLAEALREMQYCHTDKAERMANEAFQSLTTNEL